MNNLPKANELAGLIIVCMGIVILIKGPMLPDNQDKEYIGWIIIGICVVAFGLALGGFVK